jgi:uroporphyrinogen-III decarboxylase
MQGMTSKERVLAAMNHEEPDRVPVMCQLALGHYFLNCDYPACEIWFGTEVFARALVDLQRRYGFDGILVNLPGRPSNWKSELKSRGRDDSNEYLYWKSGLETIMPSDDNPHTYGPGRMPLPRADCRSVDVNDPSIYRLGGYVWNTWHAPELWGIDPQADLADPAAYPAFFTKALRRVRQLAPDVSVHVEVFSPFTHLMELFGYEQALMALIDEPGKCHCLLSAFTGQVLAQISLYGRCRPDAVLVSSAFAGAGFISREMYKEFVGTYEEQLFRAIHREGSKAYVHTCGAIGDRLDLMSQTSVDGIDTLDPPPLGTVDLAEAKSRYGGRFFFKGNLDAVNEMLNADDAVFEKAVMERLEIGRPGSGYILSSACSVAPCVEPGRLKRLAELADEFGRYR